MVRNPALSFSRRSEKLARLFRRSLDAKARRDRNPTPANCRRADAAYRAWARAS